MFSQPSPELVQQIEEKKRLALLRMTQEQDPVKRLRFILVYAELLWRQNDSKALFWLHQVTNMSAHAKAMMGDIYGNGKCGIEKDILEAQKWFKKALAQKGEHALNETRAINVRALLKTIELQLENLKKTTAAPSSSLSKKHTKKASSKLLPGSTLSSSSTSSSSSSSSPASSSSSSSSASSSGAAYPASSSSSASSLSSTPLSLRQSPALGQPAPLVQSAPLMQPAQMVQPAPVVQPTLLVQSALSVQLAPVGQPSSTSAPSSRSMVETESKKPLKTKGTHKKIMISQLRRRSAGINKKLFELRKGDVNKQFEKEIKAITEKNKTLKWDSVTPSELSKLKADLIGLEKETNQLTSRVKSEIKKHFGESKPALPLENKSSSSSYTASSSSHTVKPASTQSMSMWRHTRPFTSRFVVLEENETLTPLPASTWSWKPKRG